MARIILSDYKKTYQLIKNSIGSPHCARLIQAIEDREVGAIHQVADYGGTIKVRACNDIVAGTVIATLLDGIYPNEDVGNHVAIFVSKDADGITVFDQYKNKPPGESTIRYKGGGNARKLRKLADGTKSVLAMSADGDFYYVVEV